MLIILLLLLLIIIMASLLLSFYVTFNIMGSNTSKIKDILFVTGESLDSPDLHARRQYRPTKEVEINYKTFTPQNYYKEDATDEELSRHL
jgi:hypothetical protein